MLYHPPRHNNKEAFVKKAVKTAMYVCQQLNREVDPTTAEPPPSYTIFIESGESNMIPPSYKSCFSETLAYEFANTGGMLQASTGSLDSLSPRGAASIPASSLAGSRDLIPHMTPGGMDITVGAEDSVSQASNSSMPQIQSIKVIKAQPNSVGVRKLMKAILSLSCPWTWLTLCARQMGKLLSGQEPERRAVPTAGGASAGEIARCYQSWLWAWHPQITLTWLRQRLKKKTEEVERGKSEGAHHSNFVR